MILPNEERSWNLWSFWDLKSTESSSNTALLLRKERDELRESVKSLKHKVNGLEIQTTRMEEMLCALVKHHDIAVTWKMSKNIS